MLSALREEVGMPSDRELRDRRHQAIRDILLEGEPVRHQRELVELLRAQGFAATQSNLSRDLRDLGAVRVNGRYEIPSWMDDAEARFRQVAAFVRSVKPAGPHQTLLVTDIGAGPIVAQAIEDDEWDEAVGTLAGHSSVLILTEHVFFQKLVYERLKYYLSAVGSIQMEGEEEKDEKDEEDEEEEPAEP
jgi:transcriptional regulator of arginine metabolism